VTNISANLKWNCVSKAILCRLCPYMAVCGQHVQRVEQWEGGQLRGTWPTILQPHILPLFYHLSLLNPLLYLLYTSSHCSVACLHSVSSIHLLNV
jgi:hypothetical protein